MELKRLLPIIKHFCEKKSNTNYVLLYDLLSFDKNLFIY